MKMIKIESWAKMNGYWNKYFPDGSLVLITGVRADPAYDLGLAFRVESSDGHRAYLCSEWLNFDIEEEWEVPENALRKLCRKVRSLFLSWFKKDI